MTGEIDRVPVVLEVTAPDVADVHAALAAVVVFTGLVMEVDVSAVQDLNAEAAGALLRGALESGGARALVVRGATDAVEPVLRASADGLGLSSRLLVL